MKLVSRKNAKVDRFKVFMGFNPFFRLPGRSAETLFS
jgi:hypothetical protein